MICKNCGNDLPEGAKFCDKCGAVLEQAQSQTPGVQGAQAGGCGGPQQGAGNFNGAMRQASYMEPSKYSKVFVDPDE